MPPESSPSAPHPASGWTQHRTELRILLAALILAIIVAVAWYLVEPSFFQNLFHKKGGPLPGHVVLYFPKMWQAPDKEQLYGFVQYNTAKNAYSNVIAPTSPAAPIPYNNTVSPNGKYIFASLSTSSSTSLIAYSLSQQKAAYTIDTEPFGSLFKDPIWSPDGSHIAYQVVQVPAPGAQVASSSPRFSGFIAKADGTGKTQLGANLPVMFSPDSSQVLSVQGNGLQAFKISSSTNTSPTSGSLIALSGLGVTDAGPMLFDQTGKHMALITKETGWIIYSIDWKNGQIVKIDTTKDMGDQGIFGQDGEFLTVTSAQGIANVYTFISGSNGVYKNSYSFAPTPPDTSLVVDWMPNTQ